LFLSSVQTPGVRTGARSRAWGLGLALLLAAWGPGCQKPADTPPPLVYAGSGSISDSVLPPLSEGFVQRGGPPVEARHYVGSGEGFKFVMEERADLGGLARSLTSTEKAQHPYYVIIGYAALAVYVHPDNPLPHITRAQLKAFFTGELKNWKQVGGPDAPVELVTVELSTGSGTTDFFRDAVMEGAPFAPTRAFKHPRECLDYVASHPYALSWGTLAPNVQGIRVVPLDGVAPEPETIRTAEYPLSRPLVLATRGVPEGPLKAFLDYVMSPEGQTVVARSFIPVRGAR
jgi:phosphate transport system substrate-binding protein